MPDDKATKKVARTESRKATGKPVPKPDLPTQLLEVVRKPGVVVTLLAAVGLTGQDAVAAVNNLLSMDLPAYALFLLAGGYVFIRMAYEYLKSQRAMADNVAELRVAFDEFRGWTRDRLESGTGHIDALRDTTRTNGNRLDFLEAWKQAHDPEWTMPTPTPDA